MHRQILSGRRSSVIWLFILLVLVAIAIASYFYTVEGPRQQLAAQGTATAEARQQDATATAQAEQAEIERLYEAGVALQQAGDWAAAAESLRLVVSRDAGYVDAAQRLGDVLARMEQAQVQATAAVVALAATAQAADPATQAAAPSATAQALESRYQRALGLMRWRLAAG